MLKIIVNEKQKQLWEKLSISTSKIYIILTAVC